MITRKYEVGMLELHPGCAVDMIKQEAGRIFEESLAQMIKEKTMLESEHKVIFTVEVSIYEEIKKCCKGEEHECK